MRLDQGCSLAFDKTVYARRNVVERCINRLKQWRGLATRYEKRDVNYRAMHPLLCRGGHSVRYRVGLERRVRGS